MSGRVGGLGVFGIVDGFTIPLTPLIALPLKGRDVGSIPLAIFVLLSIIA